MTAPGASSPPDALYAGAPVDRSAYPFQSRWLAVSAGRMHYVDEGRGEPVLLIHGTPTWSFEWRHQVQALRERYRVVAPDHLGFGLSERTRDFSYTPEAHAQNLGAFVDRLGLERFTLVVHDYGGPIALPLCWHRTARVTRLAIVNSWMWSLRGDKGLELQGRLAGSRWFRFLYRRLNFSLRVIMPHAYGDRGKLTAAIHRQYLERFPDAWSRGAVLWALAKAMLGSDAYYQSLWERRDALKGRPTLLIWGLKDPAFGAQLGRWRSVLPDAEVLELPEVGHWPQEEEPERVSQALLEFLRR